MKRPIRLSAHRTGRLTQLGPPGAAPLPAAVVRRAIEASAGDELTEREALELLGALDAPPIPDWWSGVFSRRQRRCRRRLQLMLRRVAELSTTQVTQQATQFEREEIEYALASLVVDGLVVAERRSGPRHHGAAVDHEVTWWRLA